MNNTSATGGYLRPAASPAPLQDDALQDFLQELVVGVTGMDPKSVIPRWQPEPPNLKTQGTDWAAIGLMTSRPDMYAAVMHLDDGQGADQLQRHEVMEILTSFYGPNSERNAALLKDGLQIGQNREVLVANGMGLVSTGDPIAVPSLVKDRWLKRMDMPLTIKREILRVYPVENILIGRAYLDTEVIQEVLDVPTPP